MAEEPGFGGVMDEGGSGAGARIDEAAGAEKAEGSEAFRTSAGELRTGTSGVILATEIAST